jgi:hypothetical protein
VISTLAIAATVLYFRQTGEYIYNTAYADINSGWTSNDYLVASEFLYFSLQPVVVILCLYESTPWKEPLYRNVPLIIVTLLNLVFQIGYYFIQPQLSSFFEVPAISYRSLVYLFVIGAVGSIVALIWSHLIGAMRLHEQ